MPAGVKFLSVPGKPRTRKTSHLLENLSCNLTKGLLKGKEHLKRDASGILLYRLNLQVCCDTSNHCWQKKKQNYIVLY